MSKLPLKIRNFIVSPVKFEENINDKENSDKTIFKSVTNEMEYQNAFILSKHRNNIFHSPRNQIIKHFKENLNKAKEKSNNIYYKNQSWNNINTKNNPKNKLLKHKSLSKNTLAHSVSNLLVNRYQNSENIYHIANSVFLRKTNLLLHKSKAKKGENKDKIFNKFIQHDIFNNICNNHNFSNCEATNKQNVLSSISSINNSLKSKTEREKENEKDKKTNSLFSNKMAQGKFQITKIERINKNGCSKNDKKNTKNLSVDIFFKNMNLVKINHSNFNKSNCDLKKFINGKLKIF